MVCKYCLFRDLFGNQISLSLFLKRCWFLGDVDLGNCISGHQGRLWCSKALVLVKISRFLEQVWYFYSAISNRYLTEPAWIFLHDTPKVQTQPILDMDSSKRHFHAYPSLKTWHFVCLTSELSHTSYPQLSLLSIFLFLAYYLLILLIYQPFAFPSLFVSKCSSWYQGCYRLYPSWLVFFIASGAP